MADVTPGTVLRVQRGSRFVFSDGSGTPNTILLRARAGTVTITPGGHNIIRAMNEDGDYLGSSRQGAQAGVTTVAFAIKLFDCGGDPTTPAMLDYVWQNHESGTALDGWTSTDTNSDFFEMDLKISIPVRGGSGGDYEFVDLVPQPGASLSNAEDGWELSGTFECAQAFPTITKTT